MVKNKINDKDGNTLGFRCWDDEQGGFECLAGMHGLRGGGVCFTNFQIQLESACLTLTQLANSLIQLP